MKGIRCAYLRETAPSTPTVEATPDDFYGYTEQYRYLLAALPAMDPKTHQTLSKDEVMTRDCGRFESNVGTTECAAVMLDRVAAGVRQVLHRDAQQLPLARVLEGGTWAAGRRLALARRTDGAPPLQIISDGTVF